MYGGIKHMIEEKIRLCKQAGVKSQISYKIQTGKAPVDEIINVAQVMNVDLIIMVSSKITSSIKVHGIFIIGGLAVGVSTLTAAGMRILRMRILRMRIL